MVFVPLSIALNFRPLIVVSRTQLLLLGLGDNDIEVLLRRRELETAARGVYRGRGASSSWSATVWAAVLRYAPAAASGRTCLALHDLAPPPSLVEVVVAAGRSSPVSRA